MAINIRGLPHSSVSKEAVFSAGDPPQVGFLGWEDSLEKEMVTHSNNLVWRISWAEKPGRLQSVGSQELDTT